MASNTMPQVRSEARAAEPARRSELDLMEGLVVAGLVFFHTAMIFGTLDFYVDNDTQSLVVDSIVYLIGLWAMPLLFLSSGSAIWYSLGKRTTWEFIGNRCRRLLVPFATALLVFFPPIVYYMIKNDQPAFSAPYNEFCLNYLTFILKWPLFVIRAPFSEGERTGHLWYLVHLFAFSLLLLPLWLYLRKPSGRRLAGRLAGLCARPGAILLLGLPVAAIEAAFGTEFTGMWSRYAYIPFLVYGFLFEADPRFGNALRRHWKSGLALGLGLLLTAGLGGLAVLYRAGIDPLTDYGLWSVLWRLAKGANGWLVVVAILGLANQARRRQEAPQATPGTYLRPMQGRSTFTERVAEYAGEAQLPFYVLHMTPIVILGFYIVRWQVGSLVKYLAISLASFVVTLAVYDIGVRRMGLTRFLLGMRPRQTPHPQDADL